MALQPVPANATDRWFLDYITGTQPWSTEHTIGIRLGAQAGVDGASAAFLAILQGIGAGGLLAGWKPLRMRYQAAGTSFTVPAGMGTTLSAFVGTGAITGYNQVTEALETTFQGRSYATGRRVDFSVYGWRHANPLTQFRYTTGQSTQAAAVLNNLRALGQPLLTADGSTATWYDYINVNYNSYWETRKRST